jgi:hypothetical protein
LKSEVDQRRPFMSANVAPEEPSSPIIYIDRRCLRVR